MQPLNEYRNWLKLIREDENRRSPYRRDGREGMGPFISSTRKEMLAELLKTEQKLGRRLISDEELVSIQSIWAKEFDVMDTAYRIAQSHGREPWKV